MWWYLGIGLVLLIAVGISLRRSVRVSDPKGNSSDVSERMRDRMSNHHGGR